MNATPASETTEPGWPEDAVEVGRVIDAWGVKGWIKVQPFAVDPQALFSTRRWFLKAPEDGLLQRPAAHGYPPMLRVTEAKNHAELIVAQVGDVSDRAGAQALRGARIFVGRSSFPSAGPDEFYWVDLLGLAVVNREGEALGSVVGLIDTGPHSVLRVAPSGAADADEAAERLIPFVAAYVDGVSLERRVISVDWGLDY